MGKEELAYTGIERKPVGTMTCGIDQHRAGAINDITSGHQIAPHLQTVFKGAGTFLCLTMVDGENGSNADVVVDI